MHPEPSGDEIQHYTSLRSVVERLVEQLNRPDPDLDLARTLADVALNRVRQLAHAFLEGSRHRATFACAVRGGQIPRVVNTANR